MFTILMRAFFVALSLAVAAAAQCNSACLVAGCGTGGQHHQEHSQEPDKAHMGHHASEQTASHDHGQMPLSAMDHGGAASEGPAEHESSCSGHAASTFAVDGPQATASVELEPSMIAVPEYPGATGTYASAPMLGAKFFDLPAPPIPAGIGSSNIVLLI